MALIDTTILNEQLRTQIEVLRSRLEKAAQTAEETAVLRGRIVGCRFTLVLIDKLMNVQNEGME